MSSIDDKQLRRVRLLLDQAYNTPLTIGDLSREVAISPYHLIRTFRRAYKQTPHQYLMARRIAKAKELLRNSELSITEICVTIGFESLGSFSTLFRNTVGISPRAYRANSQPTTKLGYIPFCVCLIHDIQDITDL